MLSGDKVIKDLRNFHEGEFPCDLRMVDGRLLIKLQEFRDNWKQPIHPSRHMLGFARMVGDARSRHYAGDRLADAGDVFVEGNVLEAWLCAQSMGFGGIGIYFDTIRGKLQPGPMLHLDLRDEREMWFRHNNNYYKLQDNDRNYHKFLKCCLRYVEVELKING